MPEAQPGGQIGSARTFTYDDFLAFTGREAKSFFANPGLPVYPQMLTFTDYDDWQSRWHQEQHTPLERLPTAQELDFPHFFATAAECQLATGVIGLDPQAFKD